MKTLKVITFIGLLVLSGSASLVLLITGVIIYEVATITPTIHYQAKVD